MTAQTVTGEREAQALPGEAATEDTWPVLSEEQMNDMSEEELMGLLCAKADMLRVPGATRVRPTATNRGQLRFRVHSSYVDPRFPDEPVRSAVGVMYSRSGKEIHIELRDFGAHENGGDVLTAIHIIPGIDSVDHTFFDDAGNVIFEQDSRHDVLLDAHSALDAVRRAKKQDNMRDLDLTGLFRAEGLVVPGTVV